MRSRTGRSLGWFGLIGGLFPQPLHACAVCFGKSGGSELPRAFILGGAILLGCTFAILGGLALAIYRIEAARARAESRPPGSGLT